MEHPSEQSNLVDLQKFRDQRETMRDTPDSEVAARVLMQWSHPMFPPESILDSVSEGHVRGESLQELLTSLLDRAIEEEVTLADDDQLILVFNALRESFDDATQQQALAHAEILYIKSQGLGDLEASARRTMTVLTKIVHANDPPRLRPVQ
jgi:hypothetical protein